MSKHRPARRRLAAVFAIAVAVCVLLAGGFVVWAQNSYPAETEALARAKSRSGLAVRIGSEAVVLDPAVEERLGVVFYPGARVEPAAYSAVWAPIALRADVRVVIPAMPLNLAVLAPDRAEEAIAEFGSGIDRWYVGGHSLGGAMAASYIAGRPEADIQGLVLWASYATEGAGLAHRDDLRVLSVSGGRDALSTPGDIRENRSHLPDDATFQKIPGMSHAQFGAYGHQPGGGTPAISDTDAHRALTEVTARFLSPASHGDPASGAD